jgi:predicted nucleotidyltransferase
MMEGGVVHMNNQAKLKFRDTVLEQVRQIVWGELAGSSCRVYLFGSWARGEEKRSSDIDVAIKFDLYDTTAQTVIMNIRNALEESNIPYKVDVVPLNTADEVIVNKVKKEGILWGDQVKE